MRGFSSVHTQQPAGPVREIELDPYILLDDDIKYVTQDIRDVSSFYIFCYIKGNIFVTISKSIFSTQSSANMYYICIITPNELMNM